MDGSLHEEEVEQENRDRDTQRLVTQLIGTHGDTMQALVQEVSSLRAEVKVLSQTKSPPLENLEAVNVVNNNLAPPNLFSSLSFPPLRESTPQAQRQPPVFTGGLSTLVRDSHHMLYKPKDIAMLKLGELNGVQAEVRLRQFYDQVEHCVVEDESRIQVAISRVDTALATWLQGEMSREPIYLWEEFKRAIRNKFGGQVTLTQAWREIEGENYFPNENPRAFMHRLTCKLAALELQFPREHLPSSDKLIKKKLLRGLTPLAQDRLRDFLDSEIPLSKFVEMVEYERDLSRNSQLGNKNIFPVTSTNSTPPLAMPSSSSNSTDDLVRSLQKQVKELQNKLRTKTTWCAYCRTTDHLLKDCPKHPPRGVCFDCFKPNCYRGRSDCPKSSQNKNM